MLKPIEIENLKTKDLKLRNGKLLRLTGNYYDLVQCHGVVLETEDCHAKDSELNYESESSIFENHAVVSITQIVTGEFIDRVRPKDFISRCCDVNYTKLVQSIETFRTLSEKYTSGLDFGRLSMEGGLTLASDDGDLFDLADSAKLELCTQEVIKRVEISIDLLQKINSEPSLMKEFFSKLEKELTDLGCVNVIYDRPDGGDIVKHYPKYNKFVEIRAFGMRVRK